MGSQPPVRSMITDYSLNYVSFVDWKYILNNYPPNINNQNFFIDI